MKRLFAYGLSLLFLVGGLSPAFAGTTDESTDSGQSEGSAEMTGLNLLLNNYNACMTATVEKELAKAEPQLEGLEKRVCRKEYAAVDAVIPPEMKAMLQEFADQAAPP